MSVTFSTTLRIVFIQRTTKNVEIIRLITGQHKKKVLFPPPTISYVTSDQISAHSMMKNENLRERY